MADIQLVGVVSTNATTTGSTTLGLTALTGGIDTAARTGDMVIVQHGSGSTSDANLGPTSASYTEVFDLYANSTRDANMSVAYKFMGETPDTSVTVEPLTGTSSVGKPVIVSVWRGVDPSTPLDVAHVTNVVTGNMTTLAGVSITPVTPGAMVLAFGVLGVLYSSPSSSFVPSGFTDAKSGGAGTSAGVAMGTAYRLWSGSGADSGETWSQSGGVGSYNSNAGIAAKLALRPLPTTFPVGNYNSGQFFR